MALNFWARKYCFRIQTTVFVRYHYQLRQQSKSGDLQKTDKTISQAHIGPIWPTLEAGNINSAIGSTLVTYHYHCPILNPKRNSCETKKSWPLSHSRKKCSTPYFLLKETVGPLFRYVKKTHRPPFVFWKKSSPPFLSLKNTQCPFFSLKKLGAPFFSLKKSCRPLFFTWKKSPPPVDKPGPGTP